MKDVHEYSHSEWDALSHDEKEAAWDRHWLPHSKHRSFGAAVMWPSGHVTSSQPRHRSASEFWLATAVISAVLVLSYFAGYGFGLLTG